MTAESVRRRAVRSAIEHDPAAMQLTRRGTVQAKLDEYACLRRHLGQEPRTGIEAKVETSEVFVLEWRKFPHTWQQTELRMPLMPLRRVPTKHGLQFGR
jgi:hypothetical protein